jgi:competence protein ComEA
MIWLYRLQQRLSITRHEGLAVLTLTLLFVTGLTVRHVQEQQIPPVTVDSLTAKPAVNSTDAVPTPESSSAGPASPSAENPLDVNGASRTALQALPGIGPALSKRIVRYRATQRPFQRIRELRRVDGIGPKTLADLRPLVTVAPSETP